MTTCPFCDHSGTRREVHAHLTDTHPERLEVWMNHEDGRMRYRVACPVCSDAYEHRIKPRSKDPNFLETYANEIRMVAFDQLLNHLEAEHEPARKPPEGVR